MFEKKIENPVLKVWDGKLLTLQVPVALYNYLNTLTCDTPKHCSVMVKIVMLMRLFQHRREFPLNELCKAVGASHTIVSSIMGRMEKAGIIDIDRTRHSLKQGGFEYRLKIDPYEMQGVKVPYCYDLDGTVFADILNTMHECSEMDLYPNAQNPHWVDVLPSWCYTSPYWKLSYSFMSDPQYDKAGRLYECDMAVTLIKNFGKAPEFKSGRIYHPFHSVPRILRHNLMYENSRLVELFDLHASFYTLLSALLKDKLGADEFNDLFFTCFEGRFYKEIAAYTDMNIDIVKNLMQVWRNIQRIGVLHGIRFAEVSEYMEKRFPTFTGIIYNWEKKINKEGREVKTLQQDLGEYETHVFADFAKFLVDKYNITPFLLHDAVYCSENDRQKLPENINEIMNDWFLKRLNVNKI